RAAYRRKRLQASDPAAPPVSIRTSSIPEGTPCEPGRPAHLLSRTRSLDGRFGSAAADTTQLCDARHARKQGTRVASAVPRRRSMRARIPPGPRQPSVVQTLGWWARPIAFVEQCRARYGKRFTIQLLATPPFVMLSDPDEVKALFTAPPEVLHPGEGARILEPVVGRNSVILLDEGDHLEQRKLMLPAFHGEKMERLSELMTDVAERETERWPKGEPIALHPRLQALTLEIILRAVFGLDVGKRLDALRERLTTILAMGSRPMSVLPFLQHQFGGHGPWARFVGTRREADALIFALIEERRR